MADPQSAPSGEDGHDAAADPENEDPDTEAAGGTEAGTSAPDSDEADAPADAGDDVEELSTEELRRRVQEEYDFEDFGPRQMEEMSVDEWEVAFDPDSWITGDELLDRVSDDLKSQIARRDVFAVLEEVEENGRRRLLAYSDEGYALIYPDGTIEGFGTVLRDVKPTVALCSMDSYETPEPPEDGVLLPTPDEVPEASGEFGNLMLQFVAGSLVLAGVFLVGGWIVVAELSTVIAPTMGLLFLLIGLFLFGSVANARLSDRFRAEEYRERLRAIGLEDGERPDFLPMEDGEVVGPDGREAIPGEPEDAPDATDR
jgi:hypothetical protein